LCCGNGDGFFVGNVYSAGVSANTDMRFSYFAGTAFRPAKTESKPEGATVYRKFATSQINGSPGRNG